jgi:hypothetical protein
MQATIAMSLYANGIGNYFTLDDTTKGVLDNTTYVLAGDVAVDVTSDLRTVQIKRGRSRQLSKYVAGTGNMLLTNSARKYDPTYAAGPYYGSIVPGKEVVISHAGVTLATLNVADWNLAYDLGSDDTASVACVDGFQQLAQKTTTPGTATAQLTGARINAYLNDAGWPSGARAISAGQATLGADVVTSTQNTLAYLQKVEASEPGAFFISKNGLAVFKDRADLQAFTSNVTIGTGGIGFTDIQVVYGIEELYTSITVNYSGGGVTVSDATAQTNYGPLGLTVDSLLTSVNDATDLANWLLSKYKDPTYRISSVTFNMDGVTSAQVGQLLSLELGDMVLVTFTPANLGAALSQYVSVEGIQHDATPANYTMTLSLGETFAAFQLDSTTFGVLDVNALGF